MSDDCAHIRFGRGIAVVFGPMVALLDEKIGQLGDRLWAAIQDGGGADLILEELSATGLRALGDFAVAEREPEGVRVVVRGTGLATVHGTGGHVDIDAGDTRTWTEVIVSDATGFALRLGDDPIEGHLPFRVSSGLLPADQVVWGSAVEAAVLDGTDFSWVDDLRPVEMLDGPSVEPSSPAPAVPVVPEPSELRLSQQSDVVSGAQRSPEEQSSSSDWYVDASDADESEVANTALPIDEVGHASAADDEDDTREDQREATSDAGILVNSIDTILPGSYDRGGTEPGVVRLDPESSSPTEDEGHEYDALFGDTTFKAVDRAAVHFAEGDEGEQSGHVVDDEEKSRSRAMPSLLRPDEETSSMAGEGGGVISSVPVGGGASPSEAEGLGEHDGHTVSIAQLRALRSGGSSAPSSPSHVVPAPPMGGATVQALLCPSGHPSPPQAVHCRSCGVPIAGTSVVIGRPRLGRVVVSTGQVIELDRPVLLGRKPKVEGAMQGEVPQLVAIGDAQGLSRSHAMIRLEQWQVLIEDLGSANGTVVTLPGRDPRRLHQSDPVLLENGAVIDLGGEVTMSVDLGA